MRGPSVSFAVFTTKVSESHCDCEPFAAARGGASTQVQNLPMCQRAGRFPGENSRV